MLNVVNAKGAVEVYNLSGAKVAGANGDASFSLPAGIYLVRNAGKTVKAIVE